jgi:hypothetical protein
MGVDFGLGSENTPEYTPVSHWLSLYDTG